jgi:hypothetical protein
MATNTIQPWFLMLHQAPDIEKKLNSGVRVRGVIKFTELGKFKLAIFQKNKS